MDQIASESLERTRALGDRLDALMRDHTAAQVQIARMQTSIEGYVALNETLNEQLRDTNRLWSQDREMITALQLENATLKTKISDLELRIARLEDEKKVLMAQIIPVEAAKTSE
jgi:septal ring factor EnvC (AmiA/AmiB activator)